MSVSPPGWYPDPTGRRGRRYWDGHRWSAAAVATPPLPPTKPPNSSRLLILFSVGGAILVVVVFGLIALTTSQDDEPSAAETRTPTTPATSTRQPSTTLPGRPIPPSPGEAYKIGGFGNSWLAGIYEAPGAEPGELCRWVIQRDLVGDESSVIRQGYGAAGERMRVGLRDGQYFTSEGCGTWIRVGRI